MPLHSSHLYQYIFLSFFFFLHQEITRREKELIATVRLPAEAESYKVELVAQGQRYVCLYNNNCPKRKENDYIYK